MLIRAKIIHEHGIPKTKKLQGSRISAHAMPVDPGRKNLTATPVQIFAASQSLVM